MVCLEEQLTIASGWEGKEKKGEKEKKKEVEDGWMLVLVHL